MKLVILGNGFDLHHGLNTSFDNFRNWCLEDKEKKEFVEKIDSIIGNDSNDEILISWAEYELKFHEFYLFLERIISSKTYNFSSKTDFLEFLKLNIKLWEGDTKEALNRMLNILDSTDFTSTFTSARQKLDRITSELEMILENSLEALSETFSIFFNEYMKENIIPKISQVNKKKQIQDIFTEADHILTFNYTNVHKLYDINNELAIHGEIEDGTPLIIGFYHEPQINDESEEDDHLIRYNRRLFSKDTIHYKINGEDIFEKINNFIENFRDELEEIIIIGFSLGETDEYITRKILKCKNIEGYKKKIHIKNLSLLPKPLKIKIFNYEDSFNKGQKKIKEILGERYVESKIIGSGKFIPPMKSNVEFIKIDYEKDDQRIADSFISL